MKTIFFALFSLVAFSFSVSGQKAEVLYFKADLPCCMARACSALEADVKGIVEGKYKNGEVVFKEVKLTDPANKALVEKYKAGSQTVVIVATKKRAETSTDVSDIVRNYARNNQKPAFEKELLTRIESTIK